MRGDLVQRSVQEPAAGANWSFTPSESDRSRLVLVTAKLTTSAVEGERSPGIRLADQNGVHLWGVGLEHEQGAGSIVRYSFARGTQSSAYTKVVSGREVTLPLPDVVLEPGDSIHGEVDGIAAGDQWSEIVFRAIVGERWDWPQEEAQAERMLRGR